MRNRPGLKALSLACCLGFLCSAAWTQAPRPLKAPAGAKGQKFRYSMTVDPSLPSLGDLLVLDLRVEGLSALSASVAELRLDPGLSIEAESIRPYPDLPAGGAPRAGGTRPRGADFRFEMRVLDAGERKVERLAVTAAEGKLELGPFALCVVPEPTLGWRWVAPATAYRYEAFEARLEPIGARPEGRASFAAPIGASFQQSGPLAWTIIALQEGDLVLPAAVMELPKSSGTSGQGTPAGANSSGPASVAILPIPPELSASRAIGAFSVSIDGPDPAKAIAGSPARLRLELEGRGNFPALILPEPAIRLGGMALSRGDWSATRRDDYRVEGGSYAGSASLEIEVISPKAGDLSLSFPPLAFLDPEAGLSNLEIPAITMSVAPRALPSAQAPRAREARSWGPGLEEAAALWDRGRKGLALAKVYGALRSAPPLSPQARVARAAALSLASELGTEPPMVDRLPPPRFFAWPALFVALAGLGLFMLSRFRAGRGGLRCPAILAALALAFGLAALASAAERRQSYAVLWVDRLSTVPSEKSELGVSVPKGSTALVRGSYGAYSGVRLENGVEGWTPRDALFPY